MGIRSTEAGVPVPGTREGLDPEVAATDPLLKKSRPPDSISAQEKVPHRNPQPLSHEARMSHQHAESEIYRN